jgi:hypothetical protein
LVVNCIITIKSEAANPTALLLFLNINTEILRKIWIQEMDFKITERLGICTTLGNDSMSDSKQKSSYEHGSDFERLRSYVRLKLGIEGNDY